MEMLGLLALPHCNPSGTAAVALTEPIAGIPTAHLLLLTQKILK